MYKGIYFAYHNLYEGRATYHKWLARKKKNDDEKNNKLYTFNIYLLCWTMSGKLCINAYNVWGFVIKVTISFTCLSEDSKLALKKKQI